MEQFDQLYLNERMHDFTSERNNTEVDFIINCLNPEKESSIIDYCCGHGRHANILIERGYNVVGFDDSYLFIKMANGNSPVKKFFKADLRKPVKTSFHEYGYCFFSSFGFYSDQENYTMLYNMLRHVSKRFVLNVMNREWLIRNLKEEIIKKVGDTTYSIYPGFSPLTGVYRKLCIIKEPGRDVRKISEVRLYSLHDYVDMLHSTGWHVVDQYGSEIEKAPYIKDSRWLTMVIEKKLY